MVSTGRLTAMPVGGGAPLQFGALQGVSVDFTADVKELYGRNSFAVDIARGKVKVQGKASTGLINVDLYNTLFFGQTTTTGQTLVSDNEAGAVGSTAYTAATTAVTSVTTTATITTAAAHGRQVGESVVIAGVTPAGYNGTFTITSVPSTTTFTYTFAGTTIGTVQGTVTAVGLNTLAAVAQAGANYLADLGVAYATTGLFLTNVTAAGAPPLVGQYLVNAAGAYLFNPTDINKALLLTYSYNSSATGKTLLINNTLMGNVPAFQVVANGLFKTKQITLTLYSCVSSKFNLPLKQDDYTIGEFDFMAQDNGAGAVGSLTVTNT